MCHVQLATSERRLTLTALTSALGTHSSHPCRWPLSACWMSWACATSQTRKWAAPAASEACRAASGAGESTPQSAPFFA